MELTFFRELAIDSPSPTLEEAFIIECRKKEFEIVSEDILRAFKIET